MDALNFYGENWIQNMKWVDVERYLEHDDAVLLPFGQTEQHGPHLPMGADTYIAMALAESVSQKTGTLIAPPMWIGWAPRMLSFSGSFTLRAQTLINVIVDMCHSLISHGFKKLYIINGHRRENLPPMEIACTQVRYETGALAAILDPLYLGVDTVYSMRDGNANLLSHAAGFETAHILYIASQLVNMDTIDDTVSEEMFNNDVFSRVDKPIIYDTPAEFRKLRGEKGVRGDVKWATAERGKQYHDAVVDSIVKYIEKNRKLEVSLREPPSIV